MADASGGLQLFAPGQKRKRPAVVEEKPAAAGRSAFLADEDGTADKRARGGAHASGAADAIVEGLSAATTFDALGLAPWLVRNCATMKITQPTPIQRGCIPAVLRGRDIIGCAPTGSGKTAAFALPILQALLKDPYGPFAVILEPSRELAFQVAEQFAAFGAGAGIRVCTVVGGLDQIAQGVELSRAPHIIVATPGRLAHHLTLGATDVDLSLARFLVLDEADRLLEPPFWPDLEVILKAVNGVSRGSGSSSTSAASGVSSAASTKGGAATAPAPPPGLTLIPIKALTVGEGGSRATKSAAPGAAGSGSGGGSSSRRSPLQTLLLSATITPDVSGLYVGGDDAAAAGGSDAGATASAAASVEGAAASGLRSLLRLRGPATIDTSPADVTAALTVPTLKQQYVFMPDTPTVRHAYLVATLLALLAPGVLPRETVKGEAARAKALAAGKKAAAGAKAKAARAAEEDAKLARLTTGKALGGGLLAAKAKAPASGAAAGRGAASDSDDDDDDDEEEDDDEDDEDDEADEDSSDEDEDASDAGSGSRSKRRRHATASDDEDEDDEDDEDGHADDDDADEDEEGASGSGRESDGDADDAASNSDAASGDDDASDDDASDDDGDARGTARSAIVFVSTCKGAQLMSEMLRESGIPTAPLHSVMPQAKRLASLAKFRSRLVPVLVATDVASRGLDIPHVDLVLNFDVPRKPSDYVHRVGRTARAGRAGRAVTFVTQYDVALVHAIEERVLHGTRKLKSLKAAGVEEDEVLSRLTKVATAYHLAKSRLAEAGFEEAAEVHAQRKRESAARLRRMYGAAAGASGGASAGAAAAGGSSGGAAAAASSGKGSAGHTSTASAGKGKGSAKGGRGAGSMGKR